MQEIRMLEKIIRCLGEFLESFNESINLIPSQFIAPFYDIVNNKMRQFRNRTINGKDEIVIK